MEWYREAGNRTQAAFARNAGLLLLDYLSLTDARRPEAKYDATMTLCVLQALLANCVELLEAMEDHKKAFFATSLTDEAPVWGLRRSFVKENTFPGDVTLHWTLKHLRNGLSHPVARQPLVECPPTGYTTTNDPSGVVTAFRVIASPWIKRGRRSRTYDRLTAEKVVAQIKNFEATYGETGHLTPVERPDGKFDITRNGRLYWPVFVMELPLEAAQELALDLATLLSQPADETWDGHRVTQLVRDSPQKHGVLPAEDGLNQSDEGPVTHNRN